jgi:hypothetical protein
MTAYFDSAIKNGKTIAIVEQQVEASTLPNVDEGDIPWGTVIQKKLTKKLLNLLPECSYLISNLFTNEGEFYSETLGGPETRATSWRRAVLAEVANRTCRVVWTESDYNGYFR